jgi:hypothetical protein
MKPNPIALAVAAVCVLAGLTGCAPPAANSPNPKPAMRETTSTILPSDQIAGRSFIDKEQGWAVGTDAGLGSLVLRTVDGGKRWTVQLRDDNGFPLVGVCFVDALHGWAIASTGTLVGDIIATDDGGRTWHEQGTGYGPLDSIHFTDALHGTVLGWDGNSPDQKPITLITSDGGRNWSIQPKK